MGGARNSSVSIPARSTGYLLCALDSCRTQLEPAGDSARARRLQQVV